jgi:hypothetical protein
MPQTVALQRGSGTLNSGSFATLFTQSGGLATRVIVSQLVFYVGASGPVDSPQLILSHLSSNGTASVIGYAQAFASDTNLRQGQLMPSSGENGLKNASFSNSVALNGYARGTSADWLGASQGFNMDLNDSSRRSFVPQNFWIGPSDSVRINWNEGSSKVVTYGFTFVTVTES